MGNAPTLNIPTRNRISAHDAVIGRRPVFGKDDWHRTVGAITLKVEWYCWFRYGVELVSRTEIYEFSPAGTDESCPGLRRGLFSGVPPGLGRPFKSNPGLASWAKIS
jgi:hypothetical protein